MSHSSADLTAVRVIRNKLESLGGSPLLFHLKCLDDDYEVFDLLRREIAARRFFVLCDSDAARSSEWVQREREIVSRLSAKVVEHIELSADEASLDHRLRNLLDRVSVFASYASRDRNEVKPVLQSLVQDDMAVFQADEISPGANWRAEIEAALTTACARGVFLCFLSSHALASRFVSYEMEVAMELGGKCLFVALEPLPLLVGRLPTSVRQHQILDLTIAGAGSVASHVLKLMTT